MNKSEEIKRPESMQEWVAVDSNGHIAESTSTASLTPPRTPEPYVTGEPSSKKKVTPLFDRKIKDAREHKTRHREIKNERRVARKLKFGADEY